MDEVTLILGVAGLVLLFGLLSYLLNKLLGNKN